MRKTCNKERERLEIEREERQRDREAQAYIEKKKKKQLQHSDVTKHIRFVPPFNENEVDKYFLLFEKVEKDLDWPLNKHTILLKSV